MSASVSDTIKVALHYTVNARLMDALGELNDDERRRWQASADYQNKHGIDGRAVSGFCGLISVIDIVLLPHARFDLAGPGDSPATDGVVIEALDESGEQTIDLVAWTITDPGSVYTLLGRAGLLGMWAALNPATYIFGRPLIVRRSPLCWLKVGCEGAAVVIPELVARTFLDITNMGGRISGQDLGHARELRAMLRVLVDQVEIVAPKPISRAA